MRTVAVAAAALVAACSARQRSPALPPLDRDGEVHVFALAPPRGGEAEAFAVSSVSLEAGDGATVPLELAPGAREVGGREGRQVLVASGRVPPRRYLALVVGTERPGSGVTTADRVRVPLALEVDARTAAVAWLTASAAPGAPPALSAEVPARTARERAGYVADAARHEIAVFERGRWLVTSVVPTGAAPHGIALDRDGARAFVALSGEDRVAVVDVASGAASRSIPLRGGDEPRDVLLARGGELLLVLNPGSRTLSLVDTGAGQERARVPVGDAPHSVVADREGRRAYVFERRSRAIRVVDLSNAAVVRTVSTDPEPLHGQLSRDGTRLYVVHAGSAFMSVLSVPDMAVARRVFVGLGAAAVLVDPRTDLVYVAYRDDPRLSVHDAFSSLPLESIALPAAAARLALDETEDALLALLPAAGSIAVVDLTARRLRTTLHVGLRPYDISLAGGR